MKTVHFILAILVVCVLCGFAPASFNWFDCLPPFGDDDVSDDDTVPADDTTDDDSADDDTGDDSAIDDDTTIDDDVADDDSAVDDDTVPPHELWCQEGEACLELAYELVDQEDPRNISAYLFWVWQSSFDSNGCLLGWSAFAPATDCITLEMTWYATLEIVDATENVVAAGRMDAFGHGMVEHVPLWQKSFRVRMILSGEGNRRSYADSSAWVVRNLTKLPENVFQVNGFHLYRAVNSPSGVTTQGVQMTLFVMNLEPFFNLEMLMHYLTVTLSGSPGTVDHLTNFGLYNAWSEKLADGVQTGDQVVFNLEHWFVGGGIPDQLTVRADTVGMATNDAIQLCVESPNDVVADYGAEPRHFPVTGGVLVY